MGWKCAGGGGLPDKAIDCLDEAAAQVGRRGELGSG